MRMWLELEVVVTGLPLLIRPLYIRQNYLALLGIFGNTIYHQIYNNESNIYFLIIGDYEWVFFWRKVLKNQIYAHKYVIRHMG